MSRYLFPALALAMVLGGRAVAGYDAEAAARALAPFLDDRTVLVGHIRLERIDVDKVFARVEELSGKEKYLAPMLEVARSWLAAFRNAGGSEAFVVFSLIDLFDGPFFLVPLDKDGDAKALGELMTNGVTPYPSATIGGMVFAGPPSALKRLKTMKPTPRPELAKALAAAGEADGRVALIPNDDSRRVLEETIPNLPKELGGGSIKVLTRGLRWAAIGATLGTTPMQWKLTLQSPDAPSAKAIQELLARTVKAVGEVKGLRSLPNFDKLLGLLDFKADGDRVTLTVTEKDVVPLAGPYVLLARTHALRHFSMNNLHELGVAMLSYHDQHGHFPAAASYDAKGRPLLSWRVHLLPFLGQDNLYKQFKLDEPWDSDHNKKLIPKMPSVYRSAADPRMAAEGKTTYLAPLGKATMFPGKEGVRLRDVTDGTTNTIFLVDADDSRAVEWTRPEDLPIDPKEPAAGLSKRYGDVYLTLFVDGEVRALPSKIDAKTLYALFTRNGGEMVELP